MSGFCWIVVGENCCGGGWVFWFNYFYQQSVDLYFIGFYSGVGLLLELFVVGIEGIGKDIQYDRGVFVIILQLVCVGYFFLYFLFCWGIEFFLKQLFVEVVVVFIIYIVGDCVFIIWCQVDGDFYVLVFVQLVFYFFWCFKGFYNGNVLFFNCFYWSGEFFCMVV